MRTLFRSLLLASAASLALAVNVQAQGAADLLDRIQRLEAQMRQMNGQLEQLQFQNRELDSQLKRFQGDAEFRFGELEKGKGGAARPAAPPAAPAAQKPQKRSDAFFDPASQPAAPGAAPMALGAAPAMAPNDPMTAAQYPPAAAVGTQPNILANAPQDDFNSGVAQMKRREYANAEQTFRAFLQVHPRDRLAAEAYYQIGESNYMRRQYNEAAVSYLKVSTDYSKSSRGAQSLLRLGQSLHAMGEKNDACNAFAEISRKYPTASAALKASVEGEQRKYGC